MKIIIPTSSDDPLIIEEPDHYYGDPLVDPHVQITLGSETCVASLKDLLSALKAFQS